MSAENGKEVMCEGKSFHIHASATGKARRPTVESLTAGSQEQTIALPISLCTMVLCQTPFVLSK